MTTVRRPITVELRSPVTVPDGPTSGNVVTTHRFIPGSTLRGAVAATWIARNGAPEPGHPGRDEFLALFESDTLWPALFAVVDPDGPVTAQPEPASVRVCKYRPHSDCDDVVVDDASPEPPSVTTDTCPACGGPLRRGKGTISGVPLVQRTRTRVDSRGVGRTGTVADGDLFTIEALDPRGGPARTPLRLHGHLVHPARGPAAAYIENLVGTPQAVRLGRRRGVQGAATMTIGDPLEVTVGPPRPDGTLALRFLTDAIVVDDAGRPRTTFDPTTLSRLLGVEIIDVTATWVRTGRHGGWNRAAGLPKPTETVVAAGSTLICRPARPLSDDQRRDLAVRGIGLRRSEGLGAIVVDPPPWRRPRPDPGPSAATHGDDTESALAAHLADGLHARDLSWFLERLSTRLTQLEAGRPEPTPIPTRRRDDLRPDMRATVLELLASTDSDLITRVRDRLRVLTLTRTNR